MPEPAAHLRMCTQRGTATACAVCVSLWSVGTDSAEDTQGNVSLPEHPAVCCSELAGHRHTGLLCLPSASATKARAAVMHIRHVPEDSLVCLSTVFTPGEENCPREGEQIKIQFHLYQINALISGRMVEIYWYSHNSLVDFMGQLIKNILVRAMHIISRAPVFY